MNGLENIVNKIIADAEAQAAEIVAAAQKEADIALETYRSNAAIESSRIIDAATASANERETRMSSVAELEGRKKHLAVKQEMISQAFDRALEQLLNLPEDKYIDLLASLAAKGSSTKAEEIILSAKDHDAIGQKVTDQANKICGGNLVLSSETRNLAGGLILKQGLTEINCELKTQVGMLKDELAIEIANVLFA